MSKIGERLPEKKKIVQDRRKLRRAFWNREMRKWHWISSAICLVGMILFAVTGITLNHADQISAVPQIENRTEALPAAMLDVLARQP
ncbi:MAG: PepSY-associated TM helix domain-containing protein, partial [Blastopirellula sp. JB062]